MARTPMMMALLTGVLLVASCGDKDEPAGDSGATTDGADGAGDGEDGTTTDGADGTTDGTDGSGDGADGSTDGADGTTDGADGSTDGADGTTDGTDGSGDGGDATDGTEVNGTIYSGTFVVEVTETNSSTDDTCTGTAQLGLDGTALTGNVECEFAGAFSSEGTLSGIINTTVSGTDVTGDFTSDPFSETITGTIDSSSAALSFSGSFEEDGFNVVFSGTVSATPE